MLTPETLDALDNALSAVIKEAGSDPKYTTLVNHLKAAQAELPEDNDQGPGDMDDAPSGPSAFADAKAKMIAARQG